jgi:parallel beta-helix repeat protein
VADQTIQALIDQAPADSVVRVPAGNYEIDALNGFIRMKSGITLDLTGSTLQIIPNGEHAKYYWAIHVYAANNVHIKGGLIYGERDQHLGPSGEDVGGYGVGIFVAGWSTNVTIEGVVCTNHFGDGVLVHDANAVRVEGNVCDGNRRNGMSVISVNGIHVADNTFSNNGGTQPECGIDFECDIDAQSISNALVERNKFFGNAGTCCAFGSPGNYRNINVTDTNEFDHKTQPIAAVGNAAPLGTPAYAFVLNRVLGWTPCYRYWGYPTSWVRQ